MVFINNLSIEAVAILAAIFIIVLIIAVNFITRIIRIICKTIIILHLVKKVQDQHTDETEKAIAQAFTKCSDSWNMDTPHLSIKNNGTEKQISYSNRQDEKSKAFYEKLPDIIGYFRRSKKDT